MPGEPLPASVLLQGRALETVRAQLRMQEQYLEIVRAALPEALGSHCKHCVVRENRLILYAESPAWATQLRFHATALLLRLEQSLGVRPAELQVRNLLPAAPTTAVEPPHRPPPSPAAAACLRRSAADSPPEIRTALLRLCQTLETVGRSKP